MAPRRSSDSFARFLSSGALDGLRTWIEVRRAAVAQNVAIFRRIVGPKVKLWSVVKSNAYGHGLMCFSRLADKAGVDGFCVDSLVEGVRLRREGIAKPILVLGMTVPSLFEKAAAEGITLSVSSRETMAALGRARRVPDFHLKVDTGLRRQGFYPEDLQAVVRAVKKHPRLKARVRGLFTHFAAAKDPSHPTFTRKQFREFQAARELFRSNGFARVTCHAAATAGALSGKEYHADAVRVGIGLYGLFPSREIAMHFPSLRLRPVLSWRTLVGEVKKFRKGDYVGYDLTERMASSGTLAVLPVGYWHGMPTAASSVGRVLIRGQEARFVGRVSMDISVVDVTRVGLGVGDVATLVGRDGRREISAYDAARRAGIGHYEFLTRLNPLMERIPR